MTKQHIFDQITARIIEQMEDADLKGWKKPWTDLGSAEGTGLPRNIEGRPYRGANVFWLWLATRSRSG